MTGPVYDVPDEEDWRWEREAQDLRHTGLERVRAAAEKWAASTAALLGTFAAVSFVAGPGKLSDVNSAVLQRIVLICLVSAALMAAGATLSAGLAAQGNPRRVDSLDGPALRALTVERTKVAVSQLRTSRVLAVLAALTLIVGASAARLDVLADAEAASRPGALVLVTYRDQPAKCGPLQKRADKILVVDGKPVVDPVHVAEVTSCPK